MMLKSRIFALWVILLTLYSPSASAYEFRVITGFLPPWSIGQDTDHPGVLMEILREALDRAGYSNPIEMIPWTRAQSIAQHEDNIVIFPMTRLPQRENTYGWLHNVRTLEIVFISYTHKDLNLERARKLERILVQQKTPPQLLLNKRHFENLTDIADVTLNIPRILKTGRADAWFTAKDMANWVWKLAPHMPLPIVSPAIVENDLYIATSKIFPKDVADRINRALSDMKKDGRFKQIEARYKRSDDMLLD